MKRVLIGAVLFAGVVVGAAAKSQAIAQCASMVGKRGPTCVIQNSACDGSAK